MLAREYSLKKKKKIVCVPNDIIIRVRVIFILGLRDFK